MGKKKENEASESSSSPHKKHKKHKHKKHKKKRSHHPSEDEGAVIMPSEPSIGESGKPQLKLKIKLGGYTIHTKEVSRSSILDAHLLDDHLDQHSEIAGSSHHHHKVKTKDREEEAWLNALEKGELDDIGELKKMRDPANLTARQRAMLHGLSAEEEQKLLQLPTGQKPAEITEEMLEKRAERALKRRQQAKKKSEENKKLTLERLLRKQEIKSKLEKAKHKKKGNIPFVRYINSLKGVSLNYPEGLAFPLAQKPSKPVPSLKTCGVEGCLNMKRYTCSKTSVPLCSLQCYQKNLLVMNRS
ncbi:INO80 complex subunit B-like [Anneissia japonica]|uniref:INO80 complex subunit B-like n=1 Tax=Anneissia japonica TaxID=1529436 RepID=UPI0014255A82|nr:INO80 complex subunit B-like [Anneissia japonica]